MKENLLPARGRNAIYGYLSAVYGLVAWWAAEGREIDRAHRALRLQRLKVSDPEDPFAAIIRCTTDPAKADKRTRSKWSRVMRYAAAYKLDFRGAGSVHQAEGRYQRLRRDECCSPTPWYFPLARAARNRKRTQRVGAISSSGVSQKPK